MFEAIPRNAAEHNKTPQEVVKMGNNDYNYECIKNIITWTVVLLVLNNIFLDYERINKLSNFRNLIYCYSCDIFLGVYILYLYAGGIN